MISRGMTQAGNIAFTLFSKLSCLRGGILTRYHISSCIYLGTNQEQIGALWLAGWSGVIRFGKKRKMHTGDSLLVGSDEEYTHISNNGRMVPSSTIYGLS